MNKIIKHFFEIWWIPILLYLLIIVVFVVNTFILKNDTGTAVIVFYFLSLIGLISSTIYQFVKRKWIKGIISAFILGITIASFLFYSIVVLFVGALIGPDNYADNLKIPIDIKIEDPIDFTSDYNRHDSVLNWVKTDLDFQLYNSFQPGIYEYDVWLKNIEQGTIYLKAYEVTQEQELSSSSLKEASAIQVYNTEDTIKKYGTTNHFSIYEGDWDKPYAARFEVWFKPSNGAKERKLMMKNYKIEGWQH